MTDKVLGFKKDCLNLYLYNLDWIAIMHDAIELRPSSWHPLGGKQYHPSEYRNASDCICSEVVARINRDFDIEPKILHAENDKKSKFKLENLLVPVHLKSESIGFEELKKEIDTMIKYSGTALSPSKLGEFRKGYLLALKRAKIRLFSAAKKEAEKK